MALTTNKYNSVVVTLDVPLPAWITDLDDQARVAAYDGYDNMYKNAPETFAVSGRGSEDHPLYVPSARRIVETVNRYLAKGWDWTVTSLSANVANSDLVLAALSTLFTREQMHTKFFSLKRNMVKDGDSLLHIIQDVSKPAGSQITIHELDARSYFQIPNPTDAMQVDGCYIVSLYFIDQTTQVAQRLEYRKQPDGSIFTQLTFWETNAWDDRWDGHPPLKPVEVPQAYKDDKNMALLLRGTVLPTSVTALPVYHFRNRRDSSEPFGTSEISGIETLIAGVNQAASDEDITLALQGLGIYVTNATRPVNQDGTEGDWAIEPGYVLELSGNDQTFERVEGVKTLVPYQDHLNFLKDSMDSSAGLSAVATGKVDVAVAQSGVALALEMTPILSNNEEKEVELLSVLDQFLHDLVFMWMSLDGLSADPLDILLKNSFADPLPIDRDATIKELIALKAAGFISTEFAIAYLKDKLGFNFPDDMLTQILAEQDAVASRLIESTPTPAAV